MPGYVRNALGLSENMDYYWTTTESPSYWEEFDKVEPFNYTYYDANNEINFVANTGGERIYP